MVKGAGEGGFQLKRFAHERLGGADSQLKRSITPGRSVPGADSGDGDPGLAGRAGGVHERRPLEGNTVAEQDDAPELPVLGVTVECVLQAGADGGLAAFEGKPLGREGAELITEGVEVEPGVTGFEAGAKIIRSVGGDLCGGELDAGLTVEVAGVHAAGSVGEHGQPEAVRVGVVADPEGVEREQRGHGHGEQAQDEARPPQAVRQLPALRPRQPDEGGEQEHGGHGDGHGRKRCLKVHQGSSARFLKYSSTSERYLSGGGADWRL